MILLAEELLTSLPDPVPPQDLCEGDVLNERSQLFLNNDNYSGCAALQAGHSISVRATHTLPRTHIRAL